MKQITAVGSTDSCWTTRAAASRDGLPQEGQREGWFRREITKGGGGFGGKPLWRAEAEVQVRQVLTIRRGCRDFVLSFSTYMEYFKT